LKTKRFKENKKIKKPGLFSNIVLTNVMTNGIIKMQKEKRKK
jgi:hypothetical protein